MQSDAPELIEHQRLLDRYVIIDMIASGGMATIYRATDERLDRVVCVKLLRDETATEGSTAGRKEYQATYKHFLKEALALSQLQHPNTLRIYDFGYLEGTTRPFQIAEFLDGGNLEQRVRAHGAFEPTEALSTLEAVTGALEEAHEKGIVHRDVKPSNILFGRVGERMIPKLADFGIARSPHKRSDGDTTDSAVALFSPRWAAPEQIANGPIGPFTDVYSLGLVTAFMLTGVPLFEGKSVRATFAERIVGDSLVTMRLRQTGVSSAAHGALLRALAARASERFQRPQELYEALKDALASPRSAPRPRDSYVTISSYEEIVSPGERAVEVPPHEEIVVGSRRVQLTEVDPIDLTVPGADARVRVTLLWDRDGIRMNLKGLTCFVARRGGGPTPALVTKESGVARLLSSARAELGSIAWSFGTPTDEGRLFTVDGMQMLVPYGRATYALALDVGAAHPVIVVCKR